MTLTKSNLFFIFLLFVNFNFARATDGVHTSIHHHYQSPRPLGMGDAFVAVANDYNALFYNPAGLARLEEGQINMSIDLAASASYQKLLKDIDAINKKEGLTDGQKATEYNTLLQSLYGNQYSLRVGALHGIWVRPKWGFGILPMDLTIDMKIHNLGLPALNVRTYMDTTIAFGIGRDYKGVPGRLSWGTTVKMVNRAFASKQISAWDLASNSEVIKKEDLREGYTMDMDVGLLYTPFLPSEGWTSAIRLAKPTFGMVLRNVFDYGFGQSFGMIQKSPTTAPEKLYRVLDIGSKFEFPSLWIFQPRLAVDMRDIFHPNFTTRKGFHAGVEMDWRVASWWKGAWRVGVNQGYPTFGLSALLTVFNLDLVTYGEDYGSFGAPKENRMYMLKLNIDI